MVGIDFGFSSEIDLLCEIEDKLRKEKDPKIRLEILKEKEDVETRLALSRVYRGRQSSIKDLL